MARLIAPISGGPTLAARAAGHRHRQHPDRDRPVRRGGRRRTASRPRPSRCEEGLLDHWRIATNAERTADEHALMVQEFLGFHGFSFDDDIDGIAISSVVPRATAAFRDMTERYFGFRPVVIEPGVKTGHAGAHRQPARGRRRPHRQRGRRHRPLRRPGDRHRLRHRHHLRRGLGQRRAASAAPSRPASTSASTPSTSGPTRCAGSSCRSPATSSAATPSSRSSPARSTASPARSTASAPAWPTSWALQDRGHRWPGVD